MGIYRTLCRPQLHRISTYQAGLDPVYILKNIEAVFFSLVLGFDPDTGDELTGRISGVNIFNSSLSLERMIIQTTAGGEECGAPGNLVNWEEAEWTLHSQAMVAEVWAERIADPDFRS